MHGAALPLSPWRGPGRRGGDPSGIRYQCTSVGYIVACRNLAQLGVTVWVPTLEDALSRRAELFLQWCTRRQYCVDCRVSNVDFAVAAMTLLHAVKKRKVVPSAYFTVSTGRGDPDTASSTPPLQCFVVGKV